MTLIQTVSVNELQQELHNDDALIIDIRDQISYQQQHIDESINLRPKDVAEFIQSNTNHYKHVYIYCYRGNSSKQLVEQLNQQGIENAYSVDGGFESWVSQ